MTVNIVLGTVWPYFVQGHSYDVRPRYVIYGGLFFSRSVSICWRRINHSDLRIRHFFDYYVIDQIYLQHPDVIVLTNILPDPINTYLAPYRGGIVDEVNGKKIRTLDELAQAFAEPAERFVVTMIGDGPPLVLDPKKVEEARERIKTRYNVLQGTKSQQKQPMEQTSQRQEEESRMRRNVSSSSLAVILRRDSRPSRRLRRSNRPSRQR